MDIILHYAFSIFFFIVMPGYLIYLLRQSWSKIKNWTYYIHFKDGVTVPDLTGPAFAPHFTVENVSEGGTIIITSKINDVRLRQLIAKECQLAAGDFHVTDHILRMPRF